MSALSAVGTHLMDQTLTNAQIHVYSYKTHTLIYFQT